jgi:hypothetical protein
MALGRTASLIALGCALGCATYAQDEGHSAVAAGGSDELRGSAVTAGLGAFGGTVLATAGTNASGGTGKIGVAGTTSGDSFSMGGTFGTAGSVATAGAGGSAAGSAAGNRQSGGSGGGIAGGTAGSGGSAGAADHGGSGSGGALGCASHLIPVKATWTATASVEAGPCPGMPNPDYCGPASRAIDGMLTPVNMTRYTTGTGRTGTEWLQIDFGTIVTVSQVVLTTAAGTDYTHSYEVRMSDDSAKIAGAAILVSGTGQADTTTITFPGPTSGRFLRVSQTTSGASWWSIQELDASCQ